ncbi:hydrophobic protein [Streptomyces sp. NPDC001185]|uniref:hydrophobic protein n=1 Tax=Streptomyces sp. NPDC001185 TaxID=3154380 RepID=UPI003332E85B
MIVVLPLALLLFGAELAVQPLWRIAVIVPAARLLGFVVRPGAPGGRRGRRYRRHR